MTDARREIAEIALALARARQMRIDSRKRLAPGAARLTDSQIEQARFELATARREWAKQSARLWRLARKIEAGLA